MSAVLIIGIVQGLFTLLYFIIRNSGRKSSKYVVILMSSLILHMFCRLIPDLWEVFPGNYFLRINSIPLLFGPLLFFYVLFEIDEKSTFRKSYLMHLFPFAALLVFSLFFQSPPAGANAEVQWAGHRSGVSDAARAKGKPPLQVMENKMAREDVRDLPPGEKRFRPKPPPGEIKLSDVFDLLFSVPGLFIISFFLYGFKIFMMLRKHRDNIKNFFSYETELLNLRWVSLIVAAFMFATLFMFSAFFISPALKKHHILNPNLAETYGLTFFIFIFSIFSIKQPPIFGEKLLEGEEASPEKKYEKSGLGEEQQNTYIEEIEKFMRTEKPYLNGDLTINELSEELEIPRHHISQVINSRCGMNFYAYVNSFRMADVIERLNDDNFRDYSLLRIAFDSGFNTKSAFNRIFKENTGLTPSEYRKAV